MAGFLGNFQGTYDPSKVIVTLNNTIITGFADGEFINVKYDDDIFTKIRGVDGEVTRVRSLSTSGSIEITLSRASDSNKHFSGLSLLARMSRKNNIITTGIRDLSGKTLLFSSKSWVVGNDALKFDKDISDITWKIDCAEIECVVGGSNNNSVFDMIFG